jgi:predicted lysophospholipase L1 biosynthesis ABC-type transport system permease subunit
MSIFSIQFCILGAIAGLVGGVLANVFTRLISEKFINTHFEFDWPSLLCKEDT